MARLLDKFAQKLAQIGANPDMGSYCGNSARRQRVFEFPFDIVYLQRDDVLVLLALAHHSRRPGYWKKRVE
jgi:toxin ParE1/3/4